MSVSTVKGWSPERGKGHAAPRGQAGRAREGEGGVRGPALQAWARGDSYSDTVSAAAVIAAAAVGFRAAAGPARDPRPSAQDPRPARPRAANSPPHTHRTHQSRSDALRPGPSPGPGGSAEGSEATPRLSGTPAWPGPHVPGRHRSAQLSRAARGR